MSQQNVDVKVKVGVSVETGAEKDARASLPTPHPASPAPLPAPTGPYQKSLTALVICHYILAALTALFGLMTIPYIPMGWQLMHSAEGELPPVFQEAEKIMGPQPGLHDPELRLWTGAAVLSFGVIGTSLGLMHGAILAYVGRCIAKRRRWWLATIFSVFDLTYLIPLPLGTALSIFALCVLCRRAVRDQFRAASGGRKPADTSARPEAAPSGS
jgi:hypothetical protein